MWHSLPLFFLSCPVFSPCLLASVHLDSSSSSFLSLEILPIPPAKLLAIFVLGGRPHIPQTSLQLSRYLEGDLEFLILPGRPLSTEPYLQPPSTRQCLRSSLLHDCGLFGGCFPLFLGSIVFCSSHRIYHRLPREAKMESAKLA